MLPDRDYGLQMRFAKHDIAEFYKSRAADSPILTERRKWLERDPDTYRALYPEGRELLDETVEIAISLQTLPSEDDIHDFKAHDPIERCRLLGSLWEADFLLMKPDAQGVFRMVGGCLCFPSHWALREKMGQSMTAIHAPVPGLNETLGKQIDGFLQRMKPGISWERFNWGLSRTPELNLHPSRDFPQLNASVALDEVWWRLEEQSLVALPESGGILFGIKIAVKPLAEIISDPDARTGMLRALQTMPEPMARYKGIAPARERLVELVEKTPQ